MQKAPDMMQMAQEPVQMTEGMGQFAHDPLQNGGAWVQNSPGGLQMSRKAVKFRTKASNNTGVTYKNGEEHDGAVSGRLARTLTPPAP